MTHEIMNLAAPINSLSETLMSLPDSDSEAIRAGLSTINDASSQLSRFVTSYRRLSSISVPSPELVEIPALLDRVKALTEIYAADNGVTVSISKIPQSLIAYCDRDMTRRHPGQPYPQRDRGDLPRGKSLGRGIGRSG